MRQHVNPLGKNFLRSFPIPALEEIFENPRLPLHLDIGCAAGDFLFDLAISSTNWNYLGIEIREKLVVNANLKITKLEKKNLFYAYGNASNIFDHSKKNILNFTNSISFYFPDPWFKKKHYKRRVIQPKLINTLSNSLKRGSLIFIKTDVRELYDYMEFTITEDKSFKKLPYSDFLYSDSFNPYKTQTPREKYVKSNELMIFESIYRKI